VERSAETTRDDPDGEYLKRNRWFESGSLQRGVQCEPDRQAERGGGLMPGVQPGNQGASANNVRSIESAMAL
jgi:hypothetical protein